MFVRLIARLRNMPVDILNIIRIQKDLDLPNVRTTQKYIHIAMLSQSQVFAAQSL